MTPPPVFLLAYGVQSRLPDLDRPKQLLVLDEARGETVLGRTVRLLRESVEPEDVFLVAPDLEVWQRFAEAEKLQHLYAGLGTRGVVETLRGLGGVSGLYLLGDVVFSRAALKTIASYVQAYTASQNPVFFGRQGPSPATTKAWGELFGFFVPNGNDALEVFNDSVLVLSPRGSAKLWDLLDEMRHHPTTLATCFVEIDDFTEDIDLPEDVEKVLPILRRYVAEETP